MIYEINGKFVCDDEDARVLGQTGLGCGDMGARHFGGCLGPKTGVKGKALIGYVVCCQSYWAGASELPAHEKIVAQAARLIAEIREKLGLDIEESQLRLHLLFDSLNGY